MKTLTRSMVILLEYVFFSFLLTGCSNEETIPSIKCNSIKYKAAVVTTCDWVFQYVVGMFTIYKQIHTNYG